jgi:hypothetical protein
MNQQPQSIRTLKDVRDLLETGQATPLLPDSFPVPVKIGPDWWFVPVAAPAGFVPAGAERAQGFELMLDRRRAALRAIDAEDQTRRRAMT